MSFAFQKIFCFMRSPLLIVLCSTCATGILLRKLSPVAICSSLFPTFSSMGFNAFHFMLKFLINLDVSFLQDDRYGHTCILLHANIQIDQYHLLKMPSFFHCRFLTSLSKTNVHRYVGLCQGLLFHYNCELVKFIVNIVKLVILPKVFYMLNTITIKI